MNGVKWKVTKTQTKTVSDKLMPLRNVCPLTHSVMGSVSLTFLELSGASALISTQLFEFTCEKH